MGQVDEWLDTKPPESGTTKQAFEALYAKAVDLGSSSNGSFGLKLFPRHLLVLQKKYGVDVFHRLSQDFETMRLFVERRDRVAQAISFSRALQTGQWSSEGPRRDVKATYDFAQICRLYFLIGESYAFWRDYLAATGSSYEHVYYEDMVSFDDVLNTCAAFFGLGVEGFEPSPLKVQRDAMTDEFKERFKADLRVRSPLEFHPKLQAPDRTASNLAKAFRGQQTKPYPFSY